MDEAKYELELRLARERARRDKRFWRLWMDAAALQCMDFKDPTVARYVLALLFKEISGNDRISLVTWFGFADVTLDHLEKELHA